MFGLWKEKSADVPAEEQRKYTPFPPLPDGGEERFGDLSDTMDAAGRGGPKYACQLLLRHILNLEARINELERKAPNVKSDA